MKPCRSALLLAVLNSIGADLITRYTPEPNDYADVCCADALGAIAFALSRPGPWGDLIAVRWTNPDIGFIAWWADNVDEAKTNGAWFYSWVQPLIDHAYECGLVEAGT